MTEQRRVVVLGSTGSIGTQAISVAQAAADRFRIWAICSGGGDVALLAEQAAALRVSAVGVSRESVGAELRSRLAVLWDERPMLEATAASLRTTSTTQWRRSVPSGSFLRPA
jgi:1-deoxy-D-xylulose 5-phosphate reductoisomerase